MNDRMKVWLAWRGLSWPRMSWKARVRELKACREYDAANPPVRF